MTLIKSFMLVGVVSLLCGCSTWNGIREDVSKPFTAVGKVGDWIKPCTEVKKEKCKKEE